MAINHLEELIAEWYEYKGYYVKRNVSVGKRTKGGYECELDIIALNPVTKHLVHIEPSLDSLVNKKTAVSKKFLCRKEIY